MPLVLTERRAGWPWPRFWPPRRSGSRFTHLLRCSWALSWRVIFVVLALVTALSNLRAELMVRTALQRSGLSGSERLTLLTQAASLYPLDRNVRWAPLIFLRDWETRTAGPRQ